MTPSLNSIISRLHIKQLRLLIALGDHGSLLSAARQVALTQPGASKALQEIETTFGTPLFVRTNRGLEPNAVGHCVIRYARLIHTDLAHLREEIVGIMRGYGGRVSVGVIMGAVPLLTEAISAVIARHPEMSVEIVEDTSATLLSQIDAGRLDLAICRTSVSQSPYLYDSVNVQEETLAVVANVAHPLAHAERVMLSELADYRWVVYRTCRCGSCSNANSTRPVSAFPSICSKPLPRSRRSPCCRRTLRSWRWFPSTSRSSARVTASPACCRSRSHPEASLMNSSRGAARRFRRGHGCCTTRCSIRRARCAMPRMPRPAMHHESRL
ncbi:regulatory helix-turn-helix LysR family protein [Paraburkholderia sp. BL8N3]|nr:regulatory helix-turn-helix LysR family protein [Paraburkholderia sp. BL8N3]